MECPLVEMHGILLTFPGGGRQTKTSSLGVCELIMLLVLTDFTEEEYSPSLETKENLLETVGAGLWCFQKAHVFYLSLSVQYSESASL